MHVVQLDLHGSVIRPTFVVHLAVVVLLFFLAFTEHQRLAEAISSSNQEPWRAETKQKFCETIELGHARRNRRESRALLGVAICGETCGAEVQYSTVQYSILQGKVTGCRQERQQS